MRGSASLKHLNFVQQASLAFSASPNDHLQRSHFSSSYTQVDLQHKAFDELISLRQALASTNNTSWPSFQSFELWFPNLSTQRRQSWEAWCAMERRSACSQLFCGIGSCCLKKRLFTLQMRSIHAHCKEAEGARYEIHTLPKAPSPKIQGCPPFVRNLTCSMGIAQLSGRL